MIIAIRIDRFLNWTKSSPRTHRFFMCFQKNTGMNHLSFFFSKTSAPDLLLWSHAHRQRLWAFDGRCLGVACGVRAICFLESFSIGTRWSLGKMPSMNVAPPESWSREKNRTKQGDWRGSFWGWLPMSNGVGSSQSLQALSWRKTVVWLGPNGLTLVALVSQFMGV